MIDVCRPEAALTIRSDSLIVVADDHGLDLGDTGYLPRSLHRAPGA